MGMNTLQKKSIYQHKKKLSSLNLEFIHKILDTVNISLLCLIFILSFLSLNSQRQWSNLYVVLSGPSRGYVQKKLIENNIQFKHFNFTNYSDTPILYSLIDLYFISSREEGGPRTLLESFASRVPVVSTILGSIFTLKRSCEGRNIKSNLLRKR